MKLRYSGDFADFECDTCYRLTRMVIKDEKLEEYYCSYCGLKMKVEN